MNSDDAFTGLHTVGPTTHAALTPDQTLINAATAIRRFAGRPKRHPDTAAVLLRIADELRLAAFAERAESPEEAQVSWLEGDVASAVGLDAAVSSGSGSTFEADDLAELLYEANEREKELERRLDWVRALLAAYGEADPGDYEFLVYQIQAAVDGRQS